MSKKTEAEKTYEILLVRVLREELNHIIRETPPVSQQISSDEPTEKLSGVLAEMHAANLSAMCFSGGGIRSATFGLGVVQALAANKLLDKFDYLSTVSGGGYMGAWLSAWIRSEQLNKFESEPLTEDEIYKKYQTIQNAGINVVQSKLSNQSVSNADCLNPEPRQLQYLREYSNYMSPRIGLLSADTWTLAAIYTRNLFLNWTIFIPLLAAVLLLPRILLALSSLIINDGRFVNFLLPIGLAAGGAAVAFAVNKLPSKNTDIRKIKHNTDGWVLGLGVLPLLVMALAATLFWAWYKHSKTALEIPFDFLRPYLKYDTGNIIIFTVLTFLIGYLLFDLTKRPRVKIDWKGIGAAIASSVVGGFAIWLVAHNLFENDLFFEARETMSNLALYVCVAVPTYLFAFSITSTVFVGLSSGFVTDADREWLARQGAWIFIVCGAWLAVNAVVLFGPLGIETLIKSFTQIKNPDENINLPEYLTELIVPLIAAISGLVSLVGGFSGESKVRDEPNKSKLSKFLAVAPKIAGVVFLTFIFVGLAYVSGIVLFLVGNFLVGFFGSFLDWSPPVDSTHSNIISTRSILYLLVWLIALSVIGFLMACFINVNKFSFHGAYRDRIIRAYLGASNDNRKGNQFTGFDDADNFQLHRLKGQKPFHVISATLNLIGGKNLAWQNRQAASFTMSPLHCGNWLLGYRHTNEYSRNAQLPKCAKLRYCNKFGEHCENLDKCGLRGKALRLGTAMAISGAAANPNMGYYSSPVVTFLMSLFNIRLGWWLGNTGKIGDAKDFWRDKFYGKPSPSVAVLPLLNETFGRTDVEKRYLNVTDGGHFENLGLYEMVLRRCKFIVLSDAAEDKDFNFGEISNAIEKCKVDLGVDIRFNDGIEIYARDNAKAHIDTRQRFAMAEITYPETESGKNRKGHLLYIRPTIYGDESTDIEHYANSNAAFPHQGTADMFYDEKQFEAYRALGFSTMQQIVGQAGEFIKALRQDKTQTVFTEPPQASPELPPSDSMAAV